MAIKLFHFKLFSSGLTRAKMILFLLNIFPKVHQTFVMHLETDYSILNNHLIHHSSLIALENHDQKNSNPLNDFHHLVVFSHDKSLKIDQMLTSSHLI